MPYRIVVPHDFSPEADLALAWAGSLVRSAGGSLVLLHVVLVPAPRTRKLPLIPALRPTEDPAESLERLREVAQRHFDTAEVDAFETDDAGPGIVHRARELDATLVAIGARTPGRGGLSRALLGSVVDYVIWHAACPVVTVRAEG